MVWEAWARPLGAQRLVSPNVETPEMVLSAPSEADGMREKMGESLPGPAHALPCSCPQPPGPSVTPAPQSPCRAGPPEVRSEVLPFSMGTAAKQGQADGSPGQ